jgi:predicted dehydrogenase
METKTSKGKEIRIPGPDHPITISPAEGRVRVTVAGRIVAESMRANSRKTAPDFHDAVRMHKLIDAAMESSETGRRVTLSELGIWAEHSA